MLIGVSLCSNKVCIDYGTCHGLRRCQESHNRWIITCGSGVPSTPVPYLRCIGLIIPNLTNALPLHLIDHMRSTPVLVSTSHPAIYSPVAAFNGHFFGSISDRVLRSSSSSLSVSLSHNRNLHQQRGYATSWKHTTPPGKSPLKVWPFVLITVVGSATYVSMVKSRAGRMNPQLLCHTHLTVSSPFHINYANREPS